MKPNPTRDEFVNQMLLSEVLITTIVFIGVYFIFRNFWRKENKDKEGDKQIQAFSEVESSSVDSCSDLTV